MKPSYYESLKPTIHTALLNCGYAKVEFDKTKDGSDSMTYVFLLEDRWWIEITKIVTGGWYTSFSGEGFSNSSLDEVVNWHRKKTLATLQ